MNSTSGQKLLARFAQLPQLTDVASDLQNAANRH